MNSIPTLQENRIKINEKFGIKNPPSTKRKRVIDYVKKSFSSPRRETVTGVAHGCGSRARRALSLTHSGSMPRRRGKGVVKIIQSQACERFAHDAFQSSNHIVIFGRDESKSVACTLCSARTPDTMDVGVGGIGHIIIDDM